MKTNTFTNIFILILSIFQVGILFLPYIIYKFINTNSTRITNLTLQTNLTTNTAISAFLDYNFIWCFIFLSFLIISINNFVVNNSFNLSLIYNLIIIFVLNISYIMLRQSSNLQLYSLLPLILTTFYSLYTLHKIKNQTLINFNQSRLYNIGYSITASFLVFLSFDSSLELINTLGYSEYITTNPIKVYLTIWLYAIFSSMVYIKLQSKLFLITSISIILIVFINSSVHTNKELIISSFSCFLVLLYLLFTN